MNYAAAGLRTRQFLCSFSLFFVKKRENGTKREIKALVAKYKIRPAKWLGVLNLIGEAPYSLSRLLRV